MREFKVLHLFCGIGGGAKGFQKARARYASHEGRFRTLLGVDNDPAACRDFARITGAPVLCADLSKLTAPELLAACNDEWPDAVFLSAPCKGFSALLPKSRLAEAHYQRLNTLMLQGLLLVLETWPDHPPKLIISENVPRIAQRGVDLIRGVKALLAERGYRFHESTHDCGELGGLAQHRRRWLLVARHEAQVPTFLYHPPVQRVRAIGEVLEALPMPDDPRGGPMHRLPRLQWKTWLRLALIPAGGDWRSLGTRADGKTPYNNQLRLVPWGAPSVAVTGGGTPTAGGVCVADPRIEEGVEWNRGVLGVKRWDEPACTVTSNGRPGAGAFAVADPRFTGKLGGFDNHYGVERWTDPAPTITGATRPVAGAVSVGDPRFTHSPNAHRNKFRVERWEEPAGTVIGATRPGSGGMVIADPRIAAAASISERDDNWAKRPGYMHVLRWAEPSSAITGAARVSGSNAPAAVADPRIPDWDDTPDPPPVIISEDGTWHRPLTTFELAALQGNDVFDADGVPLVLDGKSHTAFRERIGNEVPPPAAQAIAEEMLKTLLAADAGATFTLGSSGIWVRDEPEVLAL